MLNWHDYRVTEREDYVWVALATLSLSQETSLSSLISIFHL